jgi:membrane protein DedA with SNARE-associated domain
MKIGAFTTYTSIGAGLWVVVLTLLGYLLGEHQNLLQRYLHVLTFASVACAVLLAGGYLLWYRYRSRPRRTHGAKERYSRSV